MSFSLPVYRSPDFDGDRFLAAPNAAFAEVTVSGVAPEGFHVTSIYPEYFKIHGRWILACPSRMDAVPVLRDDGALDIVEFRNLVVGDRVVLGRSEDGSEGIFVHPDGFMAEDESDDVFAFRTGRSRETAYSSDYDRLYELLRHERDHGRIVWVLGPAVVFDYDSKHALAQLISLGYGHTVMAGNAMATHDLEGSLIGTALGQDIYTQKPRPLGHYNHLDIINDVRRSGSLESFIEDRGIQDGVVHACISAGVRLILAGSIRDDGPLPPVYSDVYEAQDAMRSVIANATTVICLATQLHTIATGNMTPSYTVKEGRVRPVYLYNVDVSEFAVNKLRDRGTLEATTIVANVQDFLVLLRNAVCGRR